MKSNRVLNTDLPWCVSVWNLRAAALIFSCDQKWTSCFVLVGQDAILAAVPAITPNKNAETQSLITFAVLTEFLRYHSSKKSDSDHVKEKLSENLRGFQGTATASDVHRITKSTSVVMFPGAHTLPEVTDALEALDIVKDTNPFVRALQNLSPSEAWFIEARSHAQKGEFAVTMSERVSAFAKREDFTTISAALANDVSNFRTQHADVLCIVLDFAKMVDDIPQSEIAQNATIRDAFCTVITRLEEDIFTPTVNGIKKDFEQFWSSIAPMFEPAMDPPAIPGDAIQAMQNFIATSSEGIWKACPSCTTLFHHIDSKQLTADSLKAFMPRLEAAGKITIFIRDLLLVVAFLQDGKLNPEAARVDRAISVLGAVLRSNRNISALEAQATGDPDAMKDHFNGMSDFFFMKIRVITPWLARLSEELAQPMETKFVANIFTHKYLQDSQ